MESKEPDGGYIGHQIGDSLALQKSNTRDYVSAFRPHDRVNPDHIKHRGCVGGLVSSKLPHGVWIIEVEKDYLKDYFLVRWSESRKVWENLGKVKFGYL